MKDNFTYALNALLGDSREGGYSDHKDDPGKITNFGVTQKVWEEWVGHSVTEKDMRALTPAIVAPLYKQKYWDKVAGDSLPSGIDHAVFDFAVNSGVGRAAKFLQSAVGATEDGAIGPITLVKVAAQDQQKLVAAYNAARLAFLYELPIWETFRGGWATRVVEVTAEAATMTK
jgi:lysozyme family protein